MLTVVKPFLDADMSLVRAHNLTALGTALVACSPGGSRAYPVSVVSWLIVLRTAQRQTASS